MTRAFLGVYGAVSPGDLRRLEAAVGPSGIVCTAGALAIGWTGGIETASGEHGCAVAGRDSSGPGAAAIAADFARAGAAALERVRGRFALALWDNATGDGLLAVDRLGASALHLFGSDGRLYFGSEIRDLLRLLPRSPEPDVRYLACHIGGEPFPERITPYAGIERLPGGHAVDLDGGSWRIRPYWRLRYAEPSRVDRAHAALALRAELTRAVAERLERRATGILLSGGLDSAAVAGVARAESGEPLRAYSGVFPTSEAADESRLLEELTHAFALPLTTAVTRRASVLRDAAAYTREWRVPSVVPNLYFMLPLMRAAAEDSRTVLLDGEGGDELFGCVPYLAADRLRVGDAVEAVRLVRRLPWNGGRQPWRATYHLVARYGTRGALPYGAHQARRREGGAPWLSLPARRTAAAVRDLWAWKKTDAPRWWAYLSDLLTHGRVRGGAHDALRHIGAMAGVERRHPFLDDLELIELVLSLPPELAFDARYTRPLLRDAVAGLVPDSVRLRTQKADFRFAIEESLTGREQELVSSLVLAPDARIRPFISVHVAADAVAKVADPKFRPYQGALLRMLTAEIWLRSLDEPQFLDRLAERGLPTAEVELVRSKPQLTS